MIFVDLAREPDFELGALRVRPSVRQVEISGRSETLEPRILQVLVALSRKRGEVISREELIETCWNGVVVGEDSLNRCIYRLRKLGESSGAFEVETIQKVGYRLHTAGSAGAATRVSATPDSSVDPAPARKRPAWLTRPVVLSAAAIVAVLLGAAVYLGIRNSSTVDVAAPMMIAILPFDAPNGDAEAQALAHAIPAAIAEELNRAGVRVVAPAKAAPFTGELKAQAAGKLGVRLLVDGNVVRSGDTARVFVRVDHAKSGVTLLNATAEDDARSTDAFVDQLSTEIARAVSWDGAMRVLTLERPDAAEIAVIYMNQLRLLNEGDHLASLTLARRMARLAPDLPEGHLSVAIEGMQSLPMIGLSERPAQWREARAAADLAIKIGPRVGSAYAGRMLATPTPRWAERLDLVLRGVAVDPESAGATGFLNGVYMATGEVDKALTAVAKGRARDPLDLGKMVRQATALMMAGRASEVRATFAEIDRRASPNYSRAAELRTTTALWWASPEEARALLDKPVPARTGISTRHRALLNSVLAAVERRDAKAVEAVRKACSSAGEDRPMLLTCLSAGAGLGQLDLTFAAAAQLFPDMRKSLTDPEDEAWLAAPNALPEIPYLFMPWMAPARADPRIILVFEHLGLVDYWRSSGTWPDFCQTEPKSVCAQMKAT